MRDSNKKKVRRLQTWDKVGEYAGQTDEDIRAGVKGIRPKRKGARTVQNESAKVLLLGGGDACIGEEKKRQILGIERWQTGGTGAGQGALSDSAPNWRGTALQYPTKAKKVKPPKKNLTDRGIKKVLWRGVGVGNSKKKTTDRRVVVVL